MLDYLFIALPFALIWLFLFLFCSRSWQLPTTFAPLCIWGLYSGHAPWKWLLIIPLLSILVLDLHIVVSKPMFNRNINILSYLLTIPLLVLYLCYGRRFVTGSNLAVIIWGYTAQIGLLIFISKFCFSNTLLLFINRLKVKEKHCIETQILEKSTRTVARSISYYVIFDHLGEMEVSGFFYLYLKLKSIKGNNSIEIIIRKGILGTEYITGFPKLISRR